MSFENEYVKGKKKKNPLGPFLPVMGLVLIVCFGAIAVVLSEPLTVTLRDNIDNIPADPEVQYVVGFMIFLGLVLLMGLVFAIATPKPPKIATEAELKKERMAIAKEKEARKKRKRAANLAMAKERKQQESR